MALVRPDGDGPLFFFETRKECEGAMRCVNDPKRSYSGAEPSPKGLGWCAHAEKTGARRKGRDGRVWAIATTKDGTRRWAPLNAVNSEDGRRKVESLVRALENGIYPWWGKLAEGAATFAVYKNGQHAFVEAKAKTGTARLKEVAAMERELAADARTRAVVWSSMSRDTMTFFVRHILAKAGLGGLEPQAVRDIASKNRARSLRAAAANFAQLFVKKAAFPGQPKAYSFRGHERISDARVARGARRVLGAGNIAPQ